MNISKPSLSQVSGGLSLIAYVAYDMNTPRSRRFAIITGVIVLALDIFGMLRDQQSSSSQPPIFMLPPPPDHTRLDEQRSTESSESSLRRSHSILKATIGTQKEALGPRSLFETMARNIAMRREAAAPLLLL